jgi:hypothetical protein
MLWIGLWCIAFGILSKFIGITMFWRGQGVISREQDPDSFRKATGAQIVIGLLLIIGWFINLNWPSVF